MTSLSLPAMIDTDKSIPQGGLCLPQPPAGWAAPQPDACFIVAGSVTAPASPTPTVVTGQRPLVLVGGTLITIAAVLDVASHQGDPDPALSSTDCLPFPQSPDGPKPTKGGGGGAGGSFTTQAGNGGPGDGGTRSGQAAKASAIPTHLRGGCAGQPGGGRGPTEAGTGGGGRAIYLVSGGTIAITATGAINASGGGGSGSKSQTGGSGGGSGGMIVLYSPTLTVDPAAVLMANGGSGSGGADSPAGQVGANGHDPSLLMPMTPAPGGGNGGDGYPAMTTLNGRLGNSNGGGGGGGGGGAGYIRSNKPLPGVVTSPALDIVP
jgi:hypothetical protein